MRVGIWWQVTEQAWGGGNSFLRALGAELERKGHEVSFSPERGQDVVLVNSWNLGPNRLNSAGRVAEVRARGKASLLGTVAPPALWRLLWRRGPALIHRLDGVAQLARGVAGRADPIQYAVNRLCDWTVFQSRYSEESFADFGVVPAHSSIANNATDPRYFYPPSRSPGNEKLTLAASSWSPNPLKGFAWLTRLAQLPGIEVRFAGRWNPEFDGEQVVQLGTLQAIELAEALRSADAFVHPGLNESCSNSIVEALASGLPVLYIDSGGNRELAGDFGVELRDDVAASVAELQDRLPELREKVLAERDRFLIPAAAGLYLDAFEQALEVRWRVK